MLDVTDFEGQGVSIHTGFPNPGVDTALHGLDLNQLLIYNPVSTYCMAISGDDWQDIGIFSGDVALVDRALVVQPTDLVVWHAEGEFALSIAGRVPKQATVWGVVTAVIHQYRLKKEISS